MLHMGDEYAHTKNGNNNTWCQDNKLSWFLWDKLEENKAFFQFVQKCIKYRKGHQILHRQKFVDNDDIEWHGKEPFSPDWSNDSRFVAFTLKDTQHSEYIYIAFNASWKPIKVKLPHNPKPWLRVIETSRPPGEDFIDENPPPVDQSEFITILEYTAVLFKAAL